LQFGTSTSCGHSFSYFPSRQSPSWSLSFSKLSFLTVLSSLKSNPHQAFLTSTWYAVLPLSKFSARRHQGPKLSFQAPKSGPSKEQKLEMILTWFRDWQTCHPLKDLEAPLAKAASINKDAGQGLPQGVNGREQGEGWRRLGV
jgi:hypothetical protein